MVQGGSATIIKYLVCFFNLIFVITGLAFIIVGALVELRARDYLILVGDSYVSTAILLIILGVTIFVIAFIGCCGAWKENHCMVQTFAIFLVILFIMELAGGIAAYAYRGKLSGILNDNLNGTLTSSIENYDTEKSTEWDRLEHRFKCCGFEKDNRYGPLNGTGHFCCANIFNGTVCDNKLNEEPACYDTILDFFTNNIEMIGGAGIGVAVIEILGIVFACCLARAIKKEYEVV